MQTAGTEKVAQLEAELRNLEEQLRTNVAAFGSFDAAALKANAALMQGADAIAKKKEELEDYIRSQKHLAEAQSVTSRATIEMSRVFQDFFSGGGFARPADALRAISNNIEGMTLAFSNLSKVGLKGVLSSLWGPGGLILGLTVLSQIDWKWLSEKISSIFNPEAIDTYVSHVEQLQKKLDDIKDKKVTVEFTGQAKQLEAEIARIKAIHDKFLQEMEKKQVKPEAQLGADIERLLVGEKGERRPLRAAVESEFATRAGLPRAAALEAEKKRFEEISKERKLLEQEWKDFPGELGLADITRYKNLRREEVKSRKELVKLQQEQTKLIGKAQEEFEKLALEAVQASGETQKIARERLIKIFQESKVPGAPGLAQQLIRAASQSFAKFEEKELNAALKEMLDAQTRRAEARHPEMAIEAERRMFEGGAGPLVTDEMKKAVADGLEAGLTKAGERAPHEAARAIAEKAAGGLEARFAAHPGLPQEEQRSKVEVDLTKAMAKLAGIEESKHPEMILEAERRLLEKSAGAVVPEELRKAIAVGLEPELAKRGEREPGLAARMIAEKAGEGLEARFAAREGLPADERRRKVEADLTEAIAKSTGVAEKAKAIETKNQDIVITAQQEFFKQTQGGIKDITNEMRESVKQQTQQALIQRGAEPSAAGIAGAEISSEAERKFLDRLGGLAKLPPAERAGIVRKELEEAPAKEIKGRIEAPSHPAVEAAAERMFFELSKGDVSAITPKVMNAVAAFVEKTLRGLGEKGEAVKVSAREITEQARGGLEKRFAEVEERPKAERATRVKEELEDTLKKFRGIGDRGGTERQKQIGTLEQLYASVGPEVEAGILQQGDPNQIARALANKMIAERGATPAAAQQASEKIVEDAWRKAAISVQRFQDTGMNTFQAVDAAMRELLNTMGAMANRMGQFQGQFMQHAQQARGMQQQLFGRPFQNH